MANCMLLLQLIELNIFVIKQRSHMVDLEIINNNNIVIDNNMNMTPRL